MIGALDAIVAFDAHALFAAGSRSLCGANQKNGKMIPALPSQDDGIVQGIWITSSHPDVPACACHEGRER
jgi:hypothetical protein